MLTKLEQSNIKKYYELQLMDTPVIEIRMHTPEDRWPSGYFSDAEAILGVIDEFPANNLYTTINRFEGQATNRISNTAKAVSNADITHRKRLFFDFDPVRKPKTPSSDPQLDEAKARARLFMRDRQAEGWPDPVIAMSGNGYHLQYRISFESTVVSSNALSELYAAWKLKYSDSAVGFDQGVHNAARIARLYGSENMKGQPSEWLPFRHSKIIEMPPTYRTLSGVDLRKALERFKVKKLRPSRRPQYDYQTTGKGDYRTLNVEEWLIETGHYKGYNKAKGCYLIHCPFEADHTSGASYAETAIWPLEDACPTFHCFHDHCQQRQIFEVIDKIGRADEFSTKTYR